MCLDDDFMRKINVTIAEGLTNAPCTDLFLYEIPQEVEETEISKIINDFKQRKYERKRAMRDAMYDKRKRKQEEADKERRAAEMKNWKPCPGWGDITPIPGFFYFSG